MNAMTQDSSFLDFAGLRRNESQPRLNDLNPFGIPGQPYLDHRVFAAFPTSFSQLSFVTVTFPLTFAGSLKSPMFMRVVTLCYLLAAGSPAAGRRERQPGNGATSSVTDSPLRRSLIAHFVGHFVGHLVDHHCRVFRFK